MAQPSAVSISRSRASGPADRMQQVDQDDDQRGQERGEQAPVAVPAVGQQPGEHCAGNQQQRACRDHHEDDGAEHRADHRADPALQRAGEHRAEVRAQHDRDGQHHQ